MGPVRRFGAVLAVAAAIGAAGCARAVDGTAVAAPGDLGAVRGSTLVATTCRQYVAMNDADRREVITAIGADGNQLVAANPDLWIGVAAALCAFVDPGAPVRDVVTGGMR
ncbi:MAG: hypothetical protein NTY24_02060 [Mycobacterium sp.]|nr:hypothetical protein [Mycobacterium sp.]MCX6479226.1 hypothetical protein [Mycobacterium sp.]